MKDREQYNVPILRKGFAVMECLADHPGGLTMQEIINTLELPKTTAFRLLSSMVEMGYLILNPESARYTLARRLLRLGLAALGQSNIVEQALGPMRMLRDSVRESVMLGVFIANRVVLLEQVLGSHNFTFMLKPGSDFCLHASAPGKLFIAMMPDSEREAAMATIDFKRFNEHTIATREELDAELETIRTKGYALDLEEEMSGVHCVAAPVYNTFGHITAVVWTSGPSGRFDRLTMEHAIEQVKEAADRISSNLGHVKTT